MVRAGCMAVSDGVVYFASWGTHLYAVDSLSGRQLWRFKTEGMIAPSRP
jgi:outer membrane protein assembly factor BamB